MKVLSIKEPFASLIKSKIKFIETRSWKTNYRGEIYIHASIGSWKIFRGIHEYASLNQLLLDIKNKFVSIELHGNYEKTNLYIYEYLKPKYHIGTQEFFNHCSSNININNI